MSVTLTVNQAAAVANRNQEVLTAIKIDLATDLLYCDGQHTVSLDSETYTPLDFRVSNIRLDAPSSSTAVLTVVDPDGTLGAVWMANRLTGVLVTMKEALWLDGTGWVTTRTLPWYVDGVSRKEDGTMTLKLQGGAGLRTRAGLETCDRARWRYAPVPGETAYVGHTLIQA